MAIEAELKQWGNSFGIIIPKSIIEKQGLNENDKIIVNFVKKADIKNTFGSLKRKMSGQEFKDMVRKGWEKN